MAAASDLHGCIKTIACWTRSTGAQVRHRVLRRVPQLAAGGVCEGILGATGDARREAPLRLPSGQRGGCAQSVRRACFTPLHPGNLTRMERGPSPSRVGDPAKLLVVLCRRMPSPSWPGLNRGAICADFPAAGGQPALQPGRGHEAPHQRAAAGPHEGVHRPALTHASTSGFCIPAVHSKSDRQARKMDSNTLIRVGARAGGRAAD